MPAVVLAFTVSATDAVAGAYSDVLVGAKSTVNVCVPCASTVPSGGEYVNVPGVLAVASNWVADSAVPAVIAAGVAQVIFGTPWITEILVCAVAVV